MARKTIIAGNWKMHKTIGEAVKFIHSLSSRIKNPQCEILIAPSFPSIASCAAAAHGTPIQIGAQNMSDAEEGALTGEVSASMIKDAGGTFVILGHSERRLHFHETDEFIHHKIKRAILEALPFILCVGESQKEREENQSETVVKKQLDRCLKGLIKEELIHLILAYEPVWAIGTGKVATPEIAEHMHQTIRDYIAKNWKKDFAENLCILYGGSVKPENIENLLNQSNIDGALIGGASLDIEAFTKMVTKR